MTNRKIFGLALAATLGLGACAQESTGPQVLDQALTLNAAIVAADATLEDIALAGAPFAFAQGGMGFGPGAGMGPGSGMGSGAGGGMGPAGRPGGAMGIGGALSGTRTVTFLDKDGHAQASYDSLTTATIHVVVDIAGDVARNGWTGSVKRSRDMTVTGLIGAETTRTVNGKGTEAVQRSRTLDDGTTASYDVKGSFTQENMVVPAPGSDVKYPVSGKITRTMSVKVVNGPNGNVTRDVTVVITFDGDNTATAVVNGETYQIDLDARPAGFPLRGRNAACGACGQHP